MSYLVRTNACLPLVAPIAASAKPGTDDHSPTCGRAGSGAANHPSRCRCVDGSRPTDSGVPGESGWHRTRLRLPHEIDRPDRRRGRGDGDRPRQRSPSPRTIGLSEAGHRARAKLWESFPDRVRRTMDETRRRFRVRAGTSGTDDPRVAALAAAIRKQAIVRIQARTSHPRVVHPIGLQFMEGVWSVVDAANPAEPIPLSRCGDINISARTFA